MSQEKGFACEWIQFSSVNSACRCMRIYAPHLTDPDLLNISSFRLLPVTSLVPTVLSNYCSASAAIKVAEHGCAVGCRHSRRAAVREAAPARGGHRVRVNDWLHDTSRAARWVREWSRQCEHHLFLPPLFSLLPFFFAAGHSSYTWPVAGSALMMWWSHHGAWRRGAAEGHVWGRHGGHAYRRGRPSRRSCRRVRWIGARSSCLCALVSRELMPRSMQVTNTMCSWTSLSRARWACSAAWSTTHNGMAHWSRKPKRIVDDNDNDDNSNDDNMVPQLRKCMAAQMTTVAAPRKRARLCSFVLAFHGSFSVYTDSCILSLAPQYIPMIWLLCFYCLTTQCKLNIGLSIMQWLASVAWQYILANSKWVYNPLKAWQKLQGLWRLQFFLMPHMIIY